MKSIFETFEKSGSLHHAYCIEGKRSEVLVELETFFEKTLKFPTRGNPDYWKEEYDSMTIDEARGLKERSEKKAFGTGKKIFVIMANSINREAQNSLLKVFEEPTPQTHFFLITPSVEGLLPTLRSRLFIVKADETASVFRKDAEAFLGMTKAKRLDFIKKFAEEISDGDRTKTDAVMLVQQIEIIAREKIGKRPFTNEETFCFEELIKCESYLSDRAPSVKMLLEHIALIV